MTANPECGRKVAHPNRTAAKVALQRLAERTGAAVFALNVYRCRGCRRWHVGHLPVGRRQ